MTIAQNRSRLAETAFSQFNLRDAYISDQADYLSTLRDEAIFSNWGINVLVRVPVDSDGMLNENNVDEYSNFVDVEWSDSVEAVVPNFGEYRQNVSEDGMSADGTDAMYPLEVAIAGKLHLPRNSRIIFNEYNSREEMIAREWVVLGTIMKQLSGSKTYSRIARCVPARQTTFNTGELYAGTISAIHSTKPFIRHRDIMNTIQNVFTYVVDSALISTGLYNETYVEDITLEIEDDTTVYIESLTATDTLQEDIILETSNPKYFTVYETGAYFSAKTVAISVLY